MWLPFTLRFGAEWQASREALNPAPERFDAHYDAMEYALKRDPVGWTEGFLSVRGDLRVFRTTDPAFGYELVAFVQVNERAHACDLLWIGLRELAADEDTDRPPRGLP